MTSKSPESPASRSTTPAVRSRSSRSIGASATPSATRCAACCSPRWPAPPSPACGSRASRTSSRRSAGVKEDVTDIVLNLKGIVCRMHSDATEIEAPLVVTGPGDITAKDIDLPSGVEILNPDAHIATLEKKTKLEVYLTIGRGRGYRPGRGEQVARSADRRDPDRLDLLAGAPCRLQRRAGPRRPEDRLRQAHARHRDRRLDRSARRAARGRRDPDLAAGDLHRRRSRRRAARRRRRRRRSMPAWSAAPRWAPRRGRPTRWTTS